MMYKYEEQVIGDLAKVKGGKRLPKGKNLISIPNSHPYIRIRDLGKSKILELTDDYEFVDDATQSTISKYVVEKDDIVIIAGKGHENYQILGKIKHHFDDKEIAQEFLSNK